MSSPVLSVTKAYLNLVVPTSENDDRTRMAWEGPLRSHAEVAPSSVGRSVSALASGTTLGEFG